MSDNSSDKPFVCPERGCQMKFSNVDHLNVHQKRHEMKLKFPGLASAAVFPIADQTPTPSRILGNFLQNWEEVGLNTEMQEITNLTPILMDGHRSKTADDTNSNTCHSKASSVDNPFAHSFQNALKNKTLTTRLVTTASDSPLNTPSIFPNEGLMAIVNAALNTPDPDFHLDQNSDKIVITNGTTAAPTVNTTTSAAVTLCSIAGGLRADQLKPKSPLNVISTHKFNAVPVIRSVNTSAINVTQNALTCPSVPNIVISQPNHKVLKSLNPTKLRALPTGQNQNNAKTTAIIAPKAAKESSIAIANNNSLYKVILKLPDGRSVQLPLISTPITQTAIAPTISAVPSQTNHINDIAIEAMTGSTSHSNQSSSSSTSLSSLQSKVDATLAALPPKAKPGRKSKFAPEEDPKEKKARSLERNRAAAMRCRLKRKHWIDSLEEKADEYEKINEKLQSEVVALRREVTLLKTALLAHKDCPVTLQQQKVTNVTDVVTTATMNGNSHSLDHNIATNGLT